jgi:hypothetical protein
MHILEINEVAKHGAIFSGNDTASHFGSAFVFNREEDLFWFLLRYS